MKLADVPKLDAVADAPDARLAALPAETLHALLARANAATARLAAALLHASLDGPRGRKGRAEPQEWITVEAACARSSLPPRFFYKRAEMPGFPFIRRVSKRVIRIEANALADFMRSRGARK